MALGRGLFHKDQHMDRQKDQHKVHQVHKVHMGPKDLTVRKGRVRRDCKDWQTHMDRIHRQRMDRKRRRSLPEDLRGCPYA